MDKDRFFWEEEGGVLGNLGPGEHPRGILEALDELGPVQAFDPKQWAITTLSAFRIREPLAELCWVGEGVDLGDGVLEERWVIETESGQGLPGKSEYRGVEVWRR
jgi:hypothetical protein